MRTLEEIKARILELKKVNPDTCSEEEGEATVKELESLTRDADQLLKIELEKQFGPKNAVFVEIALRSMVGLPPALPPEKKSKSFTDLD